MAFSGGGSAFGQTGSTNAFGSFGTNNTATTTPSLFGQTNTTQPAAGSSTGTSIFGQSTANPTGTATGTNIFGQANANTGGPGTATNLFGQPNAQNATGTTGTSTNLFGQPANNAATSNTGTGLFGQSTNNAATGTSMFGASNNNNPNSGTGTGTGLFGQSTNQPAAGGTGLFGQSTTQPAAGTSLFGSSTTQPATGSNIFGQSTAQPASTGTNIFGQSQANTNSAFGGGGGTSLFGARPAAPALNMTMGQSQQQVGQPVFTKSTKFNDLPEDVKKVFEQIESHINGRLAISASLKRLTTGSSGPSSTTTLALTSVSNTSGTTSSTSTTGAAALQQSHELIRTIHQDLLRTAAAIHADRTLTTDVRSRTEQAVHDTIAATRIIDGFRNPHVAAHAQALRESAEFPLEFYSRLAEQTAHKMHWYRDAVEQVERTLAAILGSAQSQSHAMTPQAIGMTLQSQHATFVGLAAKVSSVHAELESVKRLYTQLWRARTGSVRDPFEERGVGDVGLEGM